MSFNPLLGTSVSNYKPSIEEELEKFDAFRNQLGFNYMTILKLLPPMIVFDISKSGTGIATWDGENCSLDTFSMSDLENDREVRNAFRQFVIDQFKDKNYEHVIIEDVIGSLNFKTANILYQLNPIVDDLMDLGLIPTKPIHRVDNGVWRMYLKEVSQYQSDIISSTDTKAFVQGCLEKLGIPAVWRNDNESDALGMLLGVGVVNILGFVCRAPNNKRILDIRKGYELKQYYTDPLTNPSVKLPKKVLQAEKVQYSAVGENTDILKISKKLVKEHGSDKVFIVKIEGEKLGIFLVEKDFVLTKEPCYVLFYHKKSI